MGVCTEERPVMHWQQSARFLGPARERSPTPPGTHISRQCGASNNNHILYRSCSSCPETCDHSTKSFEPGPIYNESFRSYDAPERAPFDESLIKYSVSARLDCPEGSDDQISGVSLKTEPYGPPSSPESSSETTLPGPEDCAGCGRFIQDRFYLSAVEKRWHAGCLQCCTCQQPLEGESSCFSKDGNIYCKSDYYRILQRSHLELRHDGLFKSVVGDRTSKKYPNLHKFQGVTAPVSNRLFGTRRCSRCLASISSSELVMRARNLVFHVNCFSCAMCNTPLNKGDQFGIRESVIFCRLHYGLSLDAQAAPTPLVNSCSYVSQFGSPPNDSSSPNDPNRIVPAGLYVPASHVISGLPQAPRQKGRPRKRKPKDIDSLTANIDLNSEYLDFGRGSHMSSSSRTKRMRTSFKHHQLRTMKSYFAINHNPDAKDLKQLSQKTGLPKRVLQVWFQNARAKWRRMMMKQDGSTMNDKGDGPLDLDSFSAHSPPFILGGPSSPHNLD